MLPLSCQQWQEEWRLLNPGPNTHTQIYTYTQIHTLAGNFLSQYLLLPAVAPRRPEASQLHLKENKPPLSLDMSQMGNLSLTSGDKRSIPELSVTENRNEQKKTRTLRKRRYLEHTQSTLWSRNEKRASQSPFEHQCLFLCILLCTFYISVLSA